MIQAVKRLKIVFGRSNASMAAGSMMRISPAILSAMSQARI